MTTALAVTDETVVLVGSFPLERGGAIEACRVGVRRVGDPDAPALLILGGISATRRVVAVEGDPGPGWWEPVVQASAVLSPSRVQLVGVDFLAGDGESSAPPAACSVTTADQARAIALVLEATGIARLEAAIGASYGGMVALALAERHPALVERVIAISAADRSHPMASAHRWIQREIVKLGEAAGDPAAGVALARALAMTTYRSANEFRDRFEAGPAGAERALAYLTSRGRDFAARWSADRFRHLSESLDLHEVDPAEITTPVTLIGVTTDALVPVWQLERLRNALADGTSLHLLDSPWGHDAFLKEPAAIARLLDLTLLNSDTP